MDNIPDDDEIVEQQIERIIMQHMFPGYTSIHRLPREEWEKLQEIIEHHRHTLLKRRLQDLKFQKRVGL